MAFASMFTRNVYRKKMSKKHIVICGMPRSGTTLLWSLLPFAYPMENWQTQSRETSARSVMNPNQNTLSKRPKDALKLSKIHWLAKLKGVDLKILFCIRDPRSVVTSRHPGVHDDYFIGWRNSYFIPDDDGSRPTLTDPGLYRFVRSWIRFASKVNLMTIRYESLVSSPQQTQERISKLIGLSPKKKFGDWNERQGVFHDHSDALNGVRELSARTEVRPGDKSRIADMAKIKAFQKSIILLGYDPSRIGVIKGATPQSHPSCWDKVKATGSELLKL